MDCLDVAFETFKRTAFRVEILPTYQIYDTSEYEEFEKYIHNIPIEGFANQPWIDDINRWVKDGKEIKRIRVEPTKYSAYYKYESHWCYPKNIAAGESIKFLSEEAYDKLSQIFGINDDFWIFDNEKVIVLKYNSFYEFEQAIEILNENLKKSYLEFYRLLENEAK